MRKALLLTAVVLFFTACNHSSTEPKPDADRVIKDTLAQNVLRSFNEKPTAEAIHVKVVPKEDHFLSGRDAVIRQLLSNIKSHPQHFTIDPTRSNELAGEFGTKLTIAPNCFIGKNGSAVSSLVDIELKECYSLDAMLRENVVTGNNNIAESKGMVSINATAAGQALQLKDGEKIKVRFPFALHGAGNYGFYYGNENTDGILNWTALHNATEQANMEKLFASREVTKPDFVFLGLGLKSYLLQTLNYPDEAKRNELSGKVGVSFFIDATGKINEVSTDPTYKTFRDEIARVLNAMPRCTPATYNGINIPSQVRLDVDFNIRRTEQVNVDFSESEVSMVNNPAEKNYLSFGNANESEVANNSAVQLFSKLGWYNCERAINTRGQKADLIVRADSKTDVKIVWRKKNSIVAGENCVGYSRFKNLPIGADVFVVALRYDKGESFYSIQPLKLEKQTVVSLNWKKGSEKEIKKALERLNV